MEISGSNFSLTNLLLCDENFCNLVDESDDDDDDDDDEYIRILLERERSNSGPKMQGFLHHSWFQTARLKGIYYILRKREVLGFGFQTAYASVTYLDRFFMETTMNMNVERSWVIRLLSMACLSLAAKMEEIRVPELSEFNFEDYSFGSSDIQKMELLVLNTLGWRMGSITPFDFIKFFANRICDTSSPPNGFSRIVELILRSMRDAKIMCHKPSVIAAAAILVVLDQGLSKDALKLKIGCLTSSHSFEIESIISCYNLFKEMDPKP